MGEYIVKAGDTLGKIAEYFYGETDKYTLIAEANQLADPDKIEVGQILKIPESPGTQPLSDVAYEEITMDQLKTIMPYASKEYRERYLAPLNKTMKKYEINTRLRQAHFLAQLAHESGSLRYAEEIASGEAYEGRADLGNTRPGDGKKFKGRGLIQLTGRANYTDYGNHINVDLTRNPEKVSENSDLAVDVAGWFWMKNKLNALADLDDIKQITFKINGGYNGLEDRKNHLKKAKAVLNING
jgi:putative chitinase